MTTLAFPYGAVNPAVTLTAVTTNGSQDIQLSPDVDSLAFVVDIGTCTGTTPTLTITVSGYSSQGNKFTLLATAAVSASSASVTEYIICPSSPVTANVSANAAVPSKINVAWTVGGTTPSINANIDLKPFKIGG